MSWVKKYIPSSRFLKIIISTFSGLALLQIYSWSMEYIDIFQLIRHSCTCGSNHYFLYRELLPTRKQLNHGFLMVKLKSLLRTFNGHHHDLVTVTDYLCRKWSRIYSFGVITIRLFPHSWPITRFVARVIRPVPHVEHLSSPSVLVGFVLLDL